MKRFAMVVAMGGMAVLTAIPALAGMSTQNHTMSGYISDSKCGAKHMGSGAACIRKCIAGGQTPVFVDDNKTVWKIDNPSAVPAGDDGKAVKVTGTMDADSHVVHIQKIRKTLEGEIKSM